MAEKTLQMALLFDFFGDLLTEKQREYFDLYYNEDLSLSEIADNVGITRQGVRDIIVRVEAQLLDYEKRTGIVARFNQRNADVDRAKEIANNILLSAENRKTADMAKELTQILESLKG